MGGLRPGAGSALAKATGACSGAVCGASRKTANSGHAVRATDEHNWQLAQLVWQSGVVGP